jgi:hypothetical protein
MATQTYEPIASTTLTATTSSITFSSIPQTYTDLVLVTAGTSTGSSQLMMTFNGVTTGYSSTHLSGTGSAISAVRYSNATSMQLGYDDYFTGGQTVAISHIMNYANTTTFKNVISRTSNAAIGVGISIGLSRSTSATTTINVFPLGSSWASGCTFNLYGIRAGN